jgi:hypothetical protein
MDLSAGHVTNRSKILTVWNSSVMEKKIGCLHDHELCSHPGLLIYAAISIMFSISRMRKKYKELQLELKMWFWIVDPWFAALSDSL